MTPSAGLIGAAILLWGQQTGYWPVALALAAIIEGPRLARRRWDLSREDFSRITDFSTLLFAGLAVLSFSKGRYPSPALQWLPACLFPIVAAQAYSVVGKTDLTALFWTLRKRAKPGDPREGVDLLLPYATVCVLSAGSANSKDSYFFPATVALTLWALWPARGRTAARVWLALAAVSAAAGWGGQLGLHRLQVYLETTLPNLVFGRAELGLDAFRSRTAIGEVGALKFSDEIILRLEPLKGAAPALLREASYNRYFAGTWHAQGAPFEEVGSDTGTAWNLAAEPSRLGEIRVSFYLPSGKGLLPLPGGTYRVTDLLAGTMRRNPLGSVHVQDGPGLAGYRARYEGLGRTLMDAPPAKADLALPAEEEKLLKELAVRLALDPRRPGEAVRKVRDFLGEGFRYSLVQEPVPAGSTPLANFLTRTRAGHCEFFATAATLLLRAGGVPARYAAGFSIQEFSPAEGAFIARKRHGHAWTLALEKGSWRDFDATPSGWADLEARRGAWLRPARDFWARLVLAVSRWRWRPAGPAGSPMKRWPAGLAAALAAAWMLRGLRRARATDGEETATNPVLLPGADSELYGVERLLAGRGLGRRNEESFRDWARRAGETVPANIRGELEAAAALHERHRFDPEGLAPAQRSELRRRARTVAGALSGKPTA